MILTSTRDITNADAHAFVHKAKQQGVDVTLSEANGMIHVYPLLPIPEAKPARTAIIEAVTG
jgi:acetyl esterase/lipase